MYTVSKVKSIFFIAEGFFTKIQIIKIELILEVVKMCRKESLKIYMMHLFFTCFLLLTSDQESL